MMIKIMYKILILIFVMSFNVSCAKTMTVMDAVDDTLRSPMTRELYREYKKTGL